MPSNSLDFYQISNITPSGHVQTMENVIKDSSLSQENQNHHQLHQKFPYCHQYLRGFLMLSNSSDFNEILNIAPSGHMQTIQNVLKDASPSQENQNHHQLHKKFPYCHRSLRGYLMPSNLSNFNQILNITPSGLVQAMQNVIKDSHPSQEHQNHRQLHQEF